MPASCRWPSCSSAPAPTATAEELREFCRQEIPERAAVPVQVVPIPVMPLTGVGKIYKPALRLEAAQRAFEAALAPLGPRA